jgi:hypothetical protein
VRLTSVSRVISLKRCWAFSACARFASSVLFLQLCSWRWVLPLLAQLFLRRSSGGDANAIFYRPPTARFSRTLHFDWAVDYFLSRA